MKHHLENHRLKISVTGTGAELASLVDKKTGHELMWQVDPNVWGSHAPVLFPIIGVLKDGKTSIDGQEFSIPKHGIVRRNDQMELYSKMEDHVTFRLCSSPETRKHYPYGFDFRVTYRLRNEHVICYFEVQNKEDRPIHFCMGGHPAFRVPFFDGDAYDDNLIRFEHPEDSESHTVTEAGTITHDTRPLPWAENGTVLPLTHELFASDALVLRDHASRSVLLESKNHGPWLKVDFAGWTHLGIWAKPDGDFVCIEPWLGLADYVDASGRFTDKEGIIELDANETYEMSFDLKVL